MNLKKEYSLNDYFNDLFKGLIPLCKKTWKPLLIILVPVSIIMGYAIAQFYNSIFSLLPAMEQNADMEIVNQLLFAELKLFGLAFIAGLAGLACTIIIISALSEDLQPDRPRLSTGDAIKAYFSRLLGSVLIQSGIILGVSILFFFLVGLFTYLSQSLAPVQGLFILLIVLLVLAYTGGLIWMVLSFSFSPFHIIIEDEKAWASIKMSTRLVRKHWWRYFGITLLFSMILSFALSMVTSPLVFLGIMPSFSNFLNYSMSNSVDEVEMLLSMMEFLKSGTFIVVMSVVNLIQSFVQMIFMTLFRTMFFADLKVRKKEWEPGAVIEG